MHKLTFCCTVVLLIASAAVLADTLTLNDGTTLEGRVAEQGEKYWIKTTDGKSRFIPKNQVKSWNKGSGVPAAGASATPATPTAKPDAGVKDTTDSKSAPAGVALSFQETKSRAERVDAPLAAVGLWQSFIDANSDSPQLAEARTELEKWKK